MKNNAPTNMHKRKKRKRRLNWKSILLALAALIVGAGIIVGIVFLVINLTQVREVTGLKFSSTAFSVTISWNRVQKDAYYEIQKKSDDGAYETIATIPSDKDTSFVEGDVPSATFFEYKVIAIRGIKDFSRRSEGKTISGYTLPVVPDECTAMTQTKNSLTVSFIDEQDVQGYEIKISENEDLSSSSNIKITYDEATYNLKEGTMNYVVEDLTEGQLYYFSIRSFVADNIYSEWSETFSGRVTRAIDMNGVDPNAPMVAITYDDGPGPGDNTKRIIDAFSKVGGHATFFQLGNRAESYPDQMQLMVNGGHEIGCHTYDHKHSGDKVDKNDIIKGNDAIENSCGIRPTVFRSPGGETTELIRDVCLSEGIPIIQWNVDTKDWKTRDAASVCDEIKRTIADGNIILMHNIYDTTATATEEILPWIVEQGYQLVTISQLIQAKTGAPPTAGIQYYTATKTK